ncbi:MAG TPA: sodium:calcium antiporter [Anaerolineaceae bacterium]|nr:sodium:calcium antiporter [Anaerolineaceae bacterium]
METLSLSLLILIGLAAIALLVIASNISVTKLVGIANYFNLSSTFMGVTIVSLATSIPEITSHLTASVKILAGTSDYEIGSAIVLGSNIGSDVVQQTLILGLVVLLSGTLYFRKYFLTKSMLPMIGTTIMCIVLGFDGTYSRIDGAILFGTFILYSYYLYVDERKHYKKEDNQPQSEEIANGIPKNKKEVLRDSAIAVGMLVITVFAATYVLTVTEIIVGRTGIGGSLIGVLTLGVASALPEFTTALAGIRHKENGISLGTLVGSNITNPLVAIGGGALISTYAVPRPLIAWDLPWETVTGLILWGILIVTKGKLKKVHAFYLIGMYFVYIILRSVFFAVD